jgi:hypothetical protein
MAVVTTFTHPRIGIIGSIAADSKGNVYFTDTGASVIFIKKKSNDSIHIFAGKYLTSEYREGTRLQARFSYPFGIACANDILYISDYIDHVIRTIDVANPDDDQTPVNLLLGGVGLSGYKEDNGSDARFNKPAGLAIYDSILYICDEGNHKIRTCNLLEDYAITKTLIGKENSNNIVVPTTDGPPLDIFLYEPAQIAVGKVGDMITVFFIQGNDYFLWKLQDDFVTRVPFYDENRMVIAIAINPLDNMLYIIDILERAILSMNISTGVRTKIAGKGDQPAILNGPVESAMFSEPHVLAVDKDSNIYVKDNEKLLRRIGAPEPVVQLAGMRKTRKRHSRKTQKGRRKSKLSRKVRH